MSLAVLAQTAQLITYHELALSAGIPAPHRIHKLTLFLEALIKEDITAKQPVRAALVVSKVTNIPAPGFFDALSGGHPLPDKLSRKSHHQALLVAINPAFES
ncbi:MAG: hypothetical protein ACON49_10140 [Candidatus Puniceispirillaceae bacterium]